MNEPRAGASTDRPAVTPGLGCEISQLRFQCISWDESRRLIEAGRDQHIYLFIVLASAIGARHMAILDLNWDRIDFAKNLIIYDEDLPFDPMSKSRPKGRATVPMSATVRRILEAAKRGALTKYVIEHGGRRLKSVREAFANAVERASLDAKVTPHPIHHTVATWLKERGGATLEQTAGFLGHADSKTAELHYFHPDATTFLGEAAKTIEATLPEIAPRSRVARPPKRPKKRDLSHRDKRPELGKS